MQSMPHGALDQWEAFDRVEPIGEHWMQTASIISMLTQILSYIGVHFGVKHPPTEPDDLMPPRYRKPKKPKLDTQQQETKSTPKESFKGLLGVIGFKPKLD